MARRQGFISTTSATSTTKSTWPRRRPPDSSPATAASSRALQTGSPRQGIPRRWRSMCGLKRCPTPVPSPPISPFLEGRFSPAPRSMQFTGTARISAGQVAALVKPVSDRLASLGRSVKVDTHAPLLTFRVDRPALTAIKTWAEVRRIYLSPDRNEGGSETLRPEILFGRQDRSRARDRGRHRLCRLREARHDRER